jgi:hypothetical protein
MTEPGGFDRKDKSVTLEVYSSEPLARMAAGWLDLEGIQCMVRAVGVGPGGWGVAANIPHALDTWESDAVLAREILELMPAEIDELLHSTEPPSSRFPVVILAVLAIVAVAIVIQGADAIFGRIFQ